VWAFSREGDAWFCPQIPSGLFFFTVIRIIE
jgi:hypothetical protein